MTAMRRLLLLLALPLLLAGCRGSLVLSGFGSDDDDSATADDDDGTDDDDAANDDDVQPDDDDVQPDDDDVQPDDDDAISECPDDGHEPNDSQNAASPLPEGTHDLHICTESDWFELCWDEGDLVGLYLWFDHDDGDIDVTLHTPTGETIFAAESGNDNEALEFQVPFEGCRYLHVYLWDDNDPGQLGNPYELEHIVD